MSLIETDGRSPRFLTRAQKWAITSESAPSSSKKWLSTDTRSVRRTSASTSARMRSAPVVAAPGRSAITVDPGVTWPPPSSLKSRHVSHSRLGQSWGDGLLLSPSPDSSHGLVEEVGQAQVPAVGDRLIVDPLPDRQVEYPHAEGRENGRTATIHRPASEDDIGERARHEASISRLLLGEMGGGVGLHDVLDVIDHVLRSQEYLGCEIAKGDMQHQRVVLEERGIGDVGRRSNGREKDQITGPHKLCDVGNNRDRTVLLKAARCVSEFLTLERRPVV